MIRTILLAALVVSTLASCAPESGTSHNLYSPSGGDPSGRVSYMGGFPQSTVNVNHAQVLSQTTTPSPSQQSGRAMQIAVTRGFTLRLPGNEAAGLHQKHLAECARLECTVLETRLDQLNGGSVSARSSVRVAPDSYRAFAAVITAPPAEVTTQFERAEDMVVAVLDIDKRQEVKTALRDRLNAMLNDPGTKSAADLAAIEKELAQAQGDIETATAQRNYLRTITETVRVDINYDGRPVVFAGYDFSPIKRAVGDIGQTLIASIASLIVALTAALPWLPVIVFAVWGARRGLRRWRAQKTPARNAT